MDLSQAWIALVGTLFGGAGFKILEYWLSKNQRTDDSALNMRKELRDEIQYLRKQLLDAERDLDKWKGDYYNLREQFLSVKNDLEASMLGIKHSADVIMDENLKNHA